MLKLYLHDCCSLWIRTCARDSTSKNLQMEAKWEANISSLLDKIKPPLLEDAGLEDCALPSDSIQEAFPKAATLSDDIFSTTPVMNQKEIASMIYGLETNRIDSSDLQTINLIIREIMVFRKLAKRLLGRIGYSKTTRYGLKNVVITKVDQPNHHYDGEHCPPSPLLVIAGYCCFSLTLPPDETPKILNVSPLTVDNGMLKLYLHDCCSLWIRTCARDSTSKNLQMEATGEANISSLLDKIKPSLLEDEGLEDCALPPDSIQEAFLKAAMLSAHIFSTTPVTNQKEIESMIYGLETNMEVIDSSDLQTINLIILMFSFKHVNDLITLMRCKSINFTQTTRYGLKNTVITDVDQPNHCYDGEHYLPSTLLVIAGYCCFSLTLPPDETPKILNVSPLTVDNESTSTSTTKNGAKSKHHPSNQNSNTQPPPPTQPSVEMQTERREKAIAVDMENEEVLRTLVDTG
uniref:Uncharacterized protein n=1 Tax=Lactuca sativa TaxID=4236 RepID=A0A9R1VYQ8_LACSA|nr:hypothetical protein LSAT_V11C400219520 [Lactuca sativa]